jgi:effector-binding domain-containing protein
MRKILWALVAVGLIILMWYLFIRPFEFEVNFTAKTLPGDIIQTIRVWNRSLDNAEALEVDSVYRLKQNIIWDNRSYVYNWYFKTINDSTTHVNVTITQPARSIRNKLLVPFSEQDVEQDASVIVRQFYDILQMHLKITNVEVLGESETEPAFCVCRSLETNQIEKANGMMKDYELLTSFISHFNLIANGPPIIKVTEWSHNVGSLKYDFCFPIVKTESLPVSSSIFYKEFNKEKVLKAVYHGNYITSDRAWYELIRFANSNGYKINGLPMEHFHNNPNLGLDEKKWKADVYLPIL